MRSKDLREYNRLDNVALRLIVLHDLELLAPRDGPPDATRSAPMPSVEPRTKRKLSCPIGIQQRKSRRLNPAATTQALNGSANVIPSVVEPCLTLMRATHELTCGIDRPAGKDKVLLFSHDAYGVFDPFNLVKSIDLSDKAPITVKRSDLVRAKQFGHVEGVAVGHKFNTRVDIHQMCVHRGYMNGILGEFGIGAYSIVVSGVYQDNKDDGDGHSLFYTGEGGRASGNSKCKAKPTMDERKTVLRLCFIVHD